MTKVTIDNTKCTCPIEPRYATNHGHLEGCPAVIKKETKSMTKDQLFNRIERKLLNAADEAFDPEEAIDSDGYDQSKREGILEALEIVKREFERK